MELFNQNMLVRIINDAEDMASDMDVIVVRKLRNAMKVQFNRDSDIMEIYENTGGQNLGKGEYLVTKNKLIATTAIMPSTIIDLIELYGISPDIGNGILLKWAFAHSSLSTVIYLLSKHSDKMKMYIDSAIIDGISHRIVPTNIFDYLIDHYHYDIHKDDEHLFSICAMGKNYTMTRYLLERGANIPIGVYRAFQLNAKKFKPMWKLLKEYRHLVIGGDI